MLKKEDFTFQILRDSIVLVTYLFEFSCFVGYTDYFKVYIENNPVPRQEDLERLHYFCITEKIKV